MTYIDDLNTHTLPMNDSKEYYIDHFDNTLSVIHTFHPENLQAVLNISQPHTVTYEISYSALDTTGTTVVFAEDFIGPYRDGWLLRQGFVPIAAGLITSTNGKKGDDFMTVGGKSWLHYFERRQYPFNGDPAHLFDEAIGGAPYGFAYYAGAVDVATILSDVLGHILSKYGSWAIDLTTLSSLTGTLANFEIPIGDESFASDFIATLSQVAPGFDYRVTWDMIFQIAAPYFFGDPTDPMVDITDPASPLWSYTLDSSDDAHDPLDVEFTNSGPGATHVAGYGSSLTGQLAVTKGYVPGHDEFHRLDESDDYSDNIATRSTLDKIVGHRISYDLQPQHEIPITVQPNQITDFWNIFRPGYAIWVDQDVGYHHIRSGQRIISMTITDNESTGEPTCDLGLNQVYDTHDNVGTDEG